MSQKPLHPAMKFDLRSYIKRTYNIDITELSEKEGSRFISNNLKNLPDWRGRINIDGQPSVSIIANPARDDFLENIEKDIRELVKALVDKGYITLTSCDGHGIDSAYVVIGFPSDDLLMQFTEKLFNEINDVWISFCRLDALCNDELSTEEIRCLNYTFFRNYETWKFLYISIGGNVNHIWENSEPTNLMDFVSWSWYTIKRTFYCILKTKKSLQHVTRIIEDKIPYFEG